MKITRVGAILLGCYRNLSSTVIQSLRVVLLRTRTARRVGRAAAWARVAAARVVAVSVHGG